MRNRERFWCFMLGVGLGLLALSLAGCSGLRYSEEANGGGVFELGGRKCCPPAEAQP